MKTKQIIFTALIFIFSINLLSAQEKITVPKITDLQKHQRLIYMFNHTGVVGLNYARSQGKTVEEYAKYFGEIGKKTWDPKAGFIGFSKGMLYNWESWRLSTSPEIIITKQTSETFQFKTPLDLKKVLGEEIYPGTTFQELMTMYRIIFEIEAKHLGVTYEQKLIDDGNWLEVTITK